MYCHLLAGHTMVLSSAKRNVVDSIEPYAVAHWATFSKLHITFYIISVPSIHGVDEEIPLLDPSN